jgi:hypothetical protein
VTYASKIDKGQDGQRLYVEVEARTDAELNENVTRQRFKIFNRIIFWLSSFVFIPELLILIVF